MKSSIIAWMLSSLSGIASNEDIGIGKNYLHEDEITALKSIVEQFLAYAEGQAKAHKPMYMRDWIEKLRLILTMNEKTILEHKGKVSHALAMQKANEEYKRYKEKERLVEHQESIKELSDDLERLKRGSVKRMGNSSK